MSLLEELNDKRQRVLDDIAIVDQDVETARQTLASAVADRASLDEKLADLDLAISALTPPLQHKGGETEAGDSADPWTEGHRAGFSAHDRDLNRSDIWQVGYSVGEIDRQRNIALGEPVPNYDGTKPEPPEPISTLQASSGEGEIIVGEPWPGPCGEIAPRAARAEANTEAALAEFMQREGAVRHNGGPRPIPVGWHFEALTRGCGVWPMRNIDVLGSHWWWEGEEKHDTNIIAYVVTEDAAKPTNAPTEPAAYSPVNNADEPVTKPEADVFSHGLQAEAEAKKDEPRKFGSIWPFGMSKADA